MKDFKKMPKMACGGKVKKYADGGSLASKSGFSNLVGRPTGEFSEAGKPLFRTSDNVVVSEKYIQKGVRRSDEEIETSLSKNRIKPTSTHNTIEEAVSAAKERSSGLIKKKRGGKVKK